MVFILDKVLVHGTAECYVELPFRRQRRWQHCQCCCVHSIQHWQEYSPFVGRRSHLVSALTAGRICLGLSLVANDACQNIVSLLVPFNAFGANCQVVQGQQVLLSKCAWRFKLRPDSSKPASTLYPYVSPSMFECGRWLQNKPSYKDPRQFF